MPLWLFFVVLFVLMVLLFFMYPHPVRLEEWEQRGLAILSEAKLTDVPPFIIHEGHRRSMLRPSSQATWVIYLVLKRGKKTFPDAVVYASLIHQLAHLTAHSTTHTTTFYTHLDSLTAAAKRLHLYDPFTMMPDPTYPPII
ncbi:Hypothetical protein POVN_LOCUS442 [uncultured virus]|nr:Hypothetical protein POVN_LOCUS442 [uncultured virus]